MKMQWLLLFSASLPALILLRDVEVTYLRFTCRQNNGNMDTTEDWVTSYRHTIYRIDLGGENVDPIGLYQIAVSLWSTNHLTVVVYYQSTGHVASKLVFPVQMLTSGYFVINPAKTYSGQWVTALASNTDVTIKFPRNMTHFDVKVNEMTYQQIRSAKFTLKILQSVQLISLDDFSGSFIYATKPVAAYMGNNNIQDDMDSNVDMAIPVDSLSNQYITFSATMSSNLYSQITYRLLGLYDKTTIKVYTDVIQTIQISKAGFFVDINLHSDGFIFLESDKYHPFHVTRLSNAGSCLTSILPSSLWKSHYDVFVKDITQTVFIITELQQLLSFIKENNFILTNCTAIKGTTMVGCMLTLSHGYHHFGFPNRSSTFVTYVSQTFKGNMEYCHNLGSPESLQDLLTNNPLFPALQYIALNDEDPFDLPTSDINITEEPSVLTTFDSTPTVEFSTTTLLSLTTSMTKSPGKHVTVCFPFQMPKSNMSSNALNSLLKIIVNDLHINYKTTLAYRMQKECMWDSRFSSFVIGISVIALVLFLGIILVCLDIVALMKYLVNSLKRRFRSH